MTNHLLISFLLLPLWPTSGIDNDDKVPIVQENLEKAQITLDSLYVHYSAEVTPLLRENYPYDKTYKASYLASNEQADKPNEYAYLWPYSGTFSAVNALFHATGDKKYKKLLDTKVLPGLEFYFDQKRSPAGYASYIHTAPPSDRFYDDNIWLGIDFTDTYKMTGEKQYLAKAKLIWDFVESGMDEKLGGGIYWCEQKKTSKNTCSNAPAAVFALKLFQASGDSTYFHKGKDLYHWTMENLQDPEDFLYFDNIKLNGELGKAKFPYNSGQMLEAAALLYQLTQNKDYLNDAQQLAKACYHYFFTSYQDAQGTSFQLLKKNDVWFIAVMLRGFIALYQVDQNKTYLNDFSKNLAHAWQHSREKNGLFNKDWSGAEKEEKKWLLTQAAMVEMYARLAAIK